MELVDQWECQSDETTPTNWSTKQLKLTAVEECGMFLYLAAVSEYFVEPHYAAIQPEIFLTRPYTLLSFICGYQSKEYG